MSVDVSFELPDPALAEHRWRLACQRDPQAHPPLVAELYAGILGARGVTVGGYLYLRDEDSDDRWESGGPGRPRPTGRGVAATHRGACRGAGWPRAGRGRRAWVGCRARCPHRRVGGGLTGRASGCPRPDRTSGRGVHRGVRGPLRGRAPRGRTSVDRVGVLTGHAPSGRGVGAEPAAAQPGQQALGDLRPDRRPARVHAGTRGGTRGVRRHDPRLAPGRADVGRGSRHGHS